MSPLDMDPSRNLGLLGIGGFFLRQSNCLCPHLGSPRDMRLNSDSNVQRKIFYNIYWFCTRSL